MEENTGITGEQELARQVRFSGSPAGSSPSLSLIWSGGLAVLFGHGGKVRDIAT